MSELIDRHDGIDLVTAVDQKPRVAGERCDVAGDRDHDGHHARGELERLCLCALARRIEHHGIEIAQLRWHQRTAEQVTRLAPDRLQSRRARRFRERGDRAGVAVIGCDAGLLGEPERKRADTAEEVENLLRLADALGD